MAAPAYHARTHRPGGTDPLDGFLELGDWITPTLLNSWANVDAGCPFRYRWGPHAADDTVNEARIEFEGQITGGVSGSVVMTFPSEDRFDCDQDFFLPMTDTDTSEVTLGEAHIDAASGDMTLTFPITGGGGGGDVASDTIWDAKGDLAVGTAADTAARLAVGTNDFVLTADSSQTTGLKWAAVSSGLAANDVSLIVSTEVFG